MKKQLKQIVLLVICLVPFVVFLGNYIYKEQQYEKMLQKLITITSLQVKTFRIYPKVSVPVGTAKEFKGQDQIVEEFFSSLTDIHRYRPSHDTVASQEHYWFLEIVIEGESIQMDCYIPSHKNNAVIGSFGNYGDFQSQNLYKWYQKYSHRWLEPEHEE